MAINISGSSKDILAPRLWVLSLLILNYKMLEFCPKSLHGNEHIFGIMYNLTHDIHVTILNAHGCIKLAFLRLRYILAFLIYFNGWSVANFNQLCLVFWNVLRVSALDFYKVYSSTINIFYIIFHLFTSDISDPEGWHFLNEYSSQFFLTLSLLKTDGL